MLSIDTNPSTTGHELTDDEPTSPDFRQELEKLAPHLLEKFDAISRSRSEEFGVYGRMYQEAKSDLTRLQGAATLSDESDRQDNHGIKYMNTASGFTNNSINDDVNISPVTNTDSTNSSAAFGDKQEVVRSARRTMFSDSPTPSVAKSSASNSSAGFNRSRAAVSAKHRTAITDSTTSPTSVTEPSDSSAGFEPPQNVVRAKERIILSDSAKSPIAVTELSNSSAGFERPQAVVESKRKIVLTDSSKSNGNRGTTSSPKARGAVTTGNALLTMRIQIRLLPVLHLLTTSDLTPPDRLRARDLAQAALQYATDCHASLALAARCSFYIAHTYYDREDKTTLGDAVFWFERATEASEADYPEGQWAQEWLNHYESVRIDADSRPSTAGSWGNKVLTGAWKMITGYNSGASSSDPVSPSAQAPKPRPRSLWRLPSGGSSRAGAVKQATGDRIPSFSSSSGTSGGTKDYHGLRWSPNSPWGKGDILNGRPFELVQSPEAIDPITEENEDEETNIPANVLSGLVEASALSPTMPKSRYRPARRWVNEDFEVPDHMLEKKYRIMNATSPSESPDVSSPLSGPKAQQLPTTSSYFEPTNNSHTRAQSFTAYPTSDPQLPTLLTDYAQSEPDNVVPRNRKRNSLSLAIIRATGRDFHRVRDEAAQMEEGESPAFAPKKEEEGLYRRRSNDVVEYEEV